MEANRLEPGTRTVLVAMGLAVAVIAYDFSSINVALPAIEADFDVDLNTAHWAVNAYLLAFGMTIVTAGRLADMFGRRRVFFVGAALFAGLAVFAGLAQSLFWLAAARAAMGVGAALMWPAILGMTFAALPTRAALAGGLMLGFAALGNLAGPLLGGLVTGVLSWRWIFPLTIVLIGTAAVAIHLRAGHAHRRDIDSSIDFAGVALLAGALLAMLLAFDQAADWGFGDPRILAMLTVVAVLLGALVLHGRRLGSRALIPPEVFRSRTFSAAFGATALASAVFFTVAMFGPQFMQKILDYSALGSGVGMVPLVATSAIFSFLSGAIYRRIGAKAAVSLGALGLVAGPLLLATISKDAGYSSLVVGLVVTGVGVGLFYGAVTTRAVTALDPSRSSFAGAMIRLPEASGGAIGLAVATMLFTFASESELRSELAQASIPLTVQEQSVVHGYLVGTDPAKNALGGLGPVKAKEAKRLVRHTFVGGLRSGLRFVAVLAALALLVSVLFVGSRAPPESQPSLR